jgi:hypothetical protein
VGDTCSVGSLRTSRIGTFLPSPEDGYSSRFRNDVISIYLEFWTVDKLYKPSCFEYKVIYLLNKNRTHNLVKDGERHRILLCQVIDCETNVFWQGCTFRSIWYFVENLSYELLVWERRRGLYKQSAARRLHGDRHCTLLCESSDPWPEIAYLTVFLHCT